MTLSVSIVTYNTAESTLRRLLHSLRQEGATDRVVLVDNSPDPRPPALLDEFDFVHHIPAGANLGYGRGHNLAVTRIKAAEHPYHLVVNPDVAWDGPVLATLRRYMDANPDVALVMPKVRYPDGELQYLCKLLPTPADLLLRRFLPPAWSRRLAADFDLRFTGYDRDMNVPYLSGCFMFLRRAAFDAVGGFDPRFFLYPEDLDLTRRLHQRWRTMFYPAVEVRHAHGQASYRSARMLVVHAWNMAKYFNKWGWWRDAERREVNRRTLAALGR